MIFDSILLVFLVATLLTGLRLYLDLQKLKTYKDDYERFLSKADVQLSDLEKITERFRYINSSEKDAFQRLTNKAKTLKDELLFVTERSEKIYQKLSARSKSIKIDTLVEDSILLDQKKEVKIDEESLVLSVKKKKLINAIKDLR
jgi:hypothetical protein